MMFCLPGLQRVSAKLCFRWRRLNAGTYRWVRQQHSHYGLWNARAGFSYQYIGALCWLRCSWYPRHLQSPVRHNAVPTAVLCPWSNSWRSGGFLLRIWNGTRHLNCISGEDWLHSLGSSSPQGGQQWFSFIAETWSSSGSVNITPGTYVSAPQLKPQQLISWIMLCLSYSRLDT